MSESTIFSPATGFGRAATAVIRISGPAAQAVIWTLCPPLPEPRRLSLRAIRDPENGEILDRGLVVYLPKPETFTGEDMVELHLHGGIAVRSAMLRVLATIPGCKPALPGDFSRRAFLNEKFDMSEAEGISDLVDAETEAQRRQALRQLDGALGKQVEAWRDRAIDLLAAAEAALDFADEGDVDEAVLDAKQRGEAATLRDAIQATLGDGRRGERLREGFRVVLAGAPNAGKSTLLNVIAGRDAAIVSEIPGTTRDAIEVHYDLRGLPLVLIDTAGLRETEDVIEAEGVRRSLRRIEDADLVLRLAAADAAEPSMEMEHFERLKVLDVLTKIDLTKDRPASLTFGLNRTASHSNPPPHPEVPKRSEGLEGGFQDPLRPLDGSFEVADATPQDEGVSGINARAGPKLAVSALTGEGLDALFAAIHRSAETTVGGDGVLVTRDRHRVALEAAKTHLDRVVAGTELPPELLAEDLRLAVRALGEIGGRVGVEDILDRLFSGFCIGK